MTPFVENRYLAGPDTRELDRAMARDHPRNLRDGAFVQAFWNLHAEDFRGHEDCGPCSLWQRAQALGIA